MAPTITYWTADCVILLINQLCLCQLSKSPYLSRLPQQRNFIEASFVQQPLTFLPILHSNSKLGQPILLLRFSNQLQYPLDHPPPTSHLTSNRRKNKQLIGGRILSSRYLEPRQFHRNYPRPIHRIHRNKEIRRPHMSYILRLAQRIQPQL